MRNLLLIIAAFGVTILCWGFYGPVLHWGQHDMSLVDGQYARLRPLVCVGMAYFAIGVVAPGVMLFLWGEKGHWTTSGIVMSLLGGAVGALGALGIILAFTYGGKPEYVMPLVFGGAPVVNSFLTIYMAKRMKEIGPIFLAGLIMVVIGAVTVLLAAPKGKPAAEMAGAPIVEEGALDEAIAAEADAPEADEVESPGAVQRAGKAATAWGLQIASIAMVIVCWGAYGPVLHKGQAAMDHSRLRPLICVGLSYFAIAVIAPNLMLLTVDEQSTYNFSGTFWSLAAGAAGAVGALGIIMAFNFGGKPVYVMPLVFGGAPVVSTLVQATSTGAFENLEPVRFAVFLAGLMLVIAGAAMVLVFAPRGGGHVKPPVKEKPVARPKDPKPAGTDGVAPTDKAKPPA